MKVLCKLLFLLILIGENWMVSSCDKSVVGDVELTEYNIYMGGIQTFNHTTPILIKKYNNEYFLGEYILKEFLGQDLIITNETDSIIEGTFVNKNPKYDYDTISFICILTSFIYKNYDGVLNGIYVINNGFYNSVEYDKFSAFQVNECNSKYYMFDKYNGNLYFDREYIYVSKDIIEFYKEQNETYWEKWQINIPERKIYIETLLLTNEIDGVFKVE